MSDPVLMRFDLHVRCENCARDSVLQLDVANVEGAPTSVPELMASSLIDQAVYVCSDCECPASQLIAVNPLANRKAEEMSQRPMAAGGRVTLFVVMGFQKNKAGKLIADQPFQVPSADVAKRRVQRYAEAGGGAIATAQTGDPMLGDWDPLEMIAHQGPVPREVLNQISEAA